MDAGIYGGTAGQGAGDLGLLPSCPGYRGTTVTGHWTAGAALSAGRLAASSNQRVRPARFKEAPYTRNVLSALAVPTPKEEHRVPLGSENALGRTRRSGRLRHPHAARSTPARGTRSSTYTCSQMSRCRLTTFHKRHPSKGKYVWKRQSDLVQWPWSLSQCTVIEQGSLKGDHVDCLAFRRKCKRCFGTHEMSIEGRCRCR